MKTTARSSPRHLFMLAGVILLAGALRLADLGGSPAGLFRDEAEKGYNAWALATTGGAVDFSGGAHPGPPIQWRRLPWMIDVMGGKTSALYQYASIPFIWIGGLNVTTTRLASAVAGTLTVALLGWLLMRAWGCWAGLAAAAWLALCPWHLVFSRWALEGIFVPFFITLTLAGVWGLDRGRRWGAPLAGAALGWLFYSYSGAQPFVLAWGACLAALYFRRLRPRNWTLWLGVALFLIPVVPTVLARLEPGGSSRLAKIAIWSAPDASPLGVAGAFVKNYLAHFDPRFLFLTGDRLPRHNLSGHGQLLPIDALLLPLGLIACFRRRLPLRGALLAAFLCGPLPAAITNEGIPHALRAFAMSVPAAAWGGLGLAELARGAYGSILRRGTPAGRARLLTAGIVAACILFGLGEARRAWRAGREDIAVKVAFENGERTAWEILARARRPGQRVFVNGNIPYAPYYEAFYFRLAPRTLPDQGLEAGGCNYFDPQQLTPDTLQRIMKPGDWVVQGVPARAFQWPDGSPLLPAGMRRRINEAWVWAEQRQ